MNIGDFAVLLGSLAFVVFLLWFFFGPRTGKSAVVRGAVQEAVQGRSTTAVGYEAP